MLKQLSPLTEKKPAHTQYVQREDNLMLLALDFQLFLNGKNLFSFMVCKVEHRGIQISDLASLSSSQ